MVDPPPVGRNLVVCCDGTSNEIVGNSTNVLKLYRIATKDARQRAFYDPGIGAIAKLPSFGRWRQRAKEFLGLATGFGLDDNILRAYGWLCDNYQPGDQIFLFGFSRGGYTVRAVAGLMHMVGLLSIDQRHLAGFALTAYKRAAESNDLSIAWQFARITAAIDAPIHFIGVWDTVASVIVPRPDRLYLPSLQFLPYTKQNDRVRTFRQALAIDERRSMFRPYGWDADKGYREHRFAKRFSTQDVKQVWFAGVHADVGGGYAEKDSALAKYPLGWMLDEACAKGLQVSKSLRAHLVEGRTLSGGRQQYTPPDVKAHPHKSLRGLWWLIELIPKKLKYRRWPRRGNSPGLYFPLGEPRLIPEGSIIHQSAAEKHETDASYDPVNWPKQFDEERMPLKPVAKRRARRKPKAPTTIGNPL